MPSEPLRGPADHTVMTPDGLLVAHIWKTPGSLRKAGAVGDATPLAWAHVEVFGSFELVARLAAGAADLEAFLFTLELEDLRVRAGEARPSATHRRF
jgi:hypothetical protein